MANYTPQSWVDGSAGGTPLNAARLNTLEAGVGAALTSADASATYVATAGVSNGTDDASALNALLTAARTAGGGLVKGLPGQSYKISSPLVIGSGTTLDMTSCTVTLNAGTNTNMVQSYGVTSGARDSNVALLGGTWARGSNGGSGSTAHSLLFRKVDGLSVRPARVTSSAGKYGVSLGDCTAFTVENIDVATQSDAVHLLGPCARGVIRNIKGSTGDDFVSITPTDYPAYTDTGGGDVTDLVIENLFPTACLSVLKVLGGNTGAAKRISVRGIHGTCSSSSSGVIWVGDDVGAAQTIGGVIDQLTLRDIDATPPGAVPLVLLNGTAMRRINIGQIRYDGTVATVSPINVAPASATTLTTLTVDDVLISNKPLYPLINTNGSATVGTLSVDSVVIDGSAGGSLIASVNAPITTMRVRGVSALGLTAAVTLVNVAASITNLIVRDAHVVSSTGATTLVAVGAATITDLLVSGCTGAVGGGYAVTLNSGSSTAAVTRARLSDITWTGGSGLVQASVSTHVLPNINASNISLLNCAWVFDLATATEAHLGNVSAVTQTSGLFLVRATAILTVYGYGIQLTGVVTSTISAGGNLRSRSMGVPLDIGISGIGKNIGDMAFNLNDNLIGGKGPAVCDGTTWVSARGYSKSGSATLVAGTVAVADTLITAGSKIRLTTLTPGGTPGSVYVASRTAGTGFTITSTSGADTSTVYYEIAAY